MEKSNDAIVLDLLKFYRDKLLDGLIVKSSPARVFTRFHLSAILGRGRNVGPLSIEGWEAAFPWEEKIREAEEKALTKICEREGGNG